MSFADDVRNAMLELLDETSGTFPITHISLHTADPGVSGANEVVGGSYARQSVTWAAASGGVKSNSAQLVFQVPSGTTITHVGGWDASTSGNFRGGGPLAQSQVFATSGSYTIEVGDLDITITDGA